MAKGKGMTMGKRFVPVGCLDPSSDSAGRSDVNAAVAAIKKSHQKVSGGSSPKRARAVKDGSAY